jgi:hypothetical protein
MNIWMKGEEVTVDCKNLHNKFFVKYWYNNQTEMDMIDKACCICGKD